MKTAAEILKGELTLGMVETLVETPHLEEFIIDAMVNYHDQFRLENRDIIIKLLNEVNVAYAYLEGIKGAVINNGMYCNTDDFIGTILKDFHSKNFNSLLSSEDASKLFKHEK